MLQLLRTKITTPPARPKRVDRTRLLTRVHDGMLRALTLVVAPAGFGKTTLVAEWARSGELPVAWLSLEVADRSPERFLSYLIQAFQQVDPKIGQTALALLHGGQVVSDESILLALLNDLSEIPRDIALILDDYHAADCPEITQIIQFLLENRPACLHVALTSRVMPSINLARLRALDQVVEITTIDLRFTDDEIRMFLEQVMDARLNAEQLARLTQSTEGWAVGLQLAGLALARQPVDWSIPAGQAHIFDYLASEVLRREAPEIQEFLKISALFDRFCVSLCDYLSSSAKFRFAESRGGDSRGFDEGWSGVLSYIERANLFLVPLDSTGTWFRYHALFTDFLRKQTTPEQSIPFYRAASQWFAQNDLTDDAVHYTIHAGDFNRAAELLEANYRMILQGGNSADLLEWLTNIPIEIMDSHPVLWLIKGWASIVAIDTKSARACMNRVRALIPPDEMADRFRGELESLEILTCSFEGRPSDPDKISHIFTLLSEQDTFLHILLHFNLGMIHLLMGRTRLAVENFLEMLALTQKMEQPLITVMTQTHLGETHMLRGELDIAKVTLKDIIQRTSESLGEQSVLLGLPYISYAELLREQNRFEEALEYAEIGIAYCTVWAPPATLDGRIALARLYAAQGNWEQAYDELKRAIKIAETSETILDDLMAVIHTVRLYLLQGNLSQAMHWANLYNIEQRAEKLPYHIQEMSRLAQLRMQIFNAGDAPESSLQAAAELGCLIEQGQALERVSPVIEALILQTYAWHNAGQHERSIDSLKQALALGGKSGYVRIFADEGLRLLHIFEQYRPHLGASTPYLNLLLSIMRDDTPRPAPHRTDLVPLTRRELDVLQLMAAGNSNQEIAAELVLTLNTVKKHVANILGKLGVANRTQAVMLARKLGWID